MYGLPGTPESRPPEVCESAHPTKLYPLPRASVLAPGRAGDDHRQGFGAPSRISVLPIAHPRSASGRGHHPNAP